VNATAATLRIALVGNPNCGKTALFNRLTGAHQKVANYAGVTVERKEGRFVAPSGRVLQLLDLPGAYSLDAASPDEAITRDICEGRHPEEPAPDLIVCVADATNLRLHLRFVLELKRLGRPMVLALNMIDAAQKRGIRIDVAALERALGMPVVETVAVKQGGAEALVARLDAMPQPTVGAPEGAMRSAGTSNGIAAEAAPAEAMPSSDLHAQVRALLADAVTMPRATSAVDDAIDSVVLHPVAGLALLALVMFLIFQAVFSWAAPLQDAVSAAVAATGAHVGAWLASMPLLQSLVTDGVFAGLGTVLEFLPQILVLFLFILILEESGYLPRAAFLLDKLMFKAGLTGRSFIPLLSSFACAIPGIMATRSIADPRDRLTTILVAPLMTCSARLPVYTLLIGAFVPARAVGPFNLRGLTLFALYVAGVLSAMEVAYVL
jgi:ferrous iron transport protein B